MSRRYQFGALFVSKWEWLKLICLSFLISLLLATPFIITVIYWEAPREVASFVSRLTFWTHEKH